MIRTEATTRCAPLDARSTAQRLADGGAAGDAAARHESLSGNAPAPTDEGHTGDGNGRSSPSGSNGHSAATVAAPTSPRPCRCGASAHPEHADRCAAGHVIPGNLTATKSGAKSLAFWSAAAPAVHQLAAEVLADQGHADVGSAPAVMRKAALALARAEVLAESCWWRVAESGGPLASSGKVRASFAAWQAADKRAESWARLLGVQRVPRAPESLETYLARAVEQREAEAATGAPVERATDSAAASAEPTATEAAPQGDSEHPRKVAQDDAKM